MPMPKKIKPTTAMLRRQEALRKKHAQRLRFDGLMGFPTITGEPMLKRCLNEVWPAFIRKVEAGEPKSATGIVYPVLSRLAATYALMAIGNLPKPKREKIYLLMQKRKRIGPTEMAQLTGDAKTAQQFVERFYLNIQELSTALNNLIIQHQREKRNP
ncbi:MAG: hypothetical protein Q7R47_01420 [Candidatus Diapherotrites archaeon]|nr:hypothetical protein [Candidatus Diapherotrites archaeon]